MLHEFDQHTGNRGAEGVISSPEKWVDSTYFPFYAAAAEMLIEARASMDTHRTGSAGTLAAFKRIIKSCENSAMKGVFERGGRFCVCDGYRLIRSNVDFSSVPHIETTFDAEKVMNSAAEKRQQLRHQESAPDPLHSDLWKRSGDRSQSGLSARYAPGAPRMHCHREKSPVCYLLFRRKR